jgi:hypothetical protein
MISEERVVPRVAGEALDRVGDHELLERPCVLGGQRAGEVSGQVVEAHPADQRDLRRRGGGPVVLHDPLDERRLARRVDVMAARGDRRLDDLVADLEERAGTGDDRGAARERGLERLAVVEGRDPGLEAVGRGRRGELLAVAAAQHGRGRRAGRAPRSRASR